MAILIASKTEQAILDQLAIPPQPEVLKELVAEIKSPNRHIASIAQCIGKDPSIAGGILQVINSPIFRREREISSLSHAVSLLGVKRVYSVAHTIALRNALDQCRGIDSFWKISNHTAHAAMKVAKFIKRKDLEDDAYLLGLFHLVGVPALNSVFSHEYRDIMSHAAVVGWTVVIDEELRYFETHHARIGGLVVQRWHSPESVVSVIAHQYTKDQLLNQEHISMDMRDLFVILKLALRVGSYVYPQMMPFAEWENLSEHLSDYLDLPDPLALEGIIDKVINEMRADSM